MRFFRWKILLWGIFGKNRAITVDVFKFLSQKIPLLDRLFFPPFWCSLSRWITRRSSNRALGAVKYYPALWDSDLTRPIFPQIWWFSKENYLISGKPKVGEILFHLARKHEIKDPYETTRMTHGKWEGFFWVFSSWFNPYTVRAVPEIWQVENPFLNRNLSRVPRPWF